MKPEDFILEDGTFVWALKEEGPFMEALKLKGFDIDDDCIDLQPTIVVKRMLKKWYNGAIRKQRAKELSQKKALIKKQPRKEYTVSEKVINKSWVNNLKSGKYSITLANISQCATCPIRDECTDKVGTRVEQYQKRGNMKKGCNQIRTLYNHHLKGLGNHERYLMSEIAYLQSKIDMQEQKDNFNKDVISPQAIKAKELIIKMIKQLADVKGKTSSRNNIIPIEAEVVSFNQDDSEVEKEAKVDLYLPEPE